MKRASGTMCIVRGNMAGTFARFGCGVVTHIAIESRENAPACSKMFPSGIQ